ncbi:MAG: hypothetical protein IPM17_18740 [Verrucomicrobia bacterium]|nr:hypothetical protein [Verrucomicrobiota bacterium]
MIRDSRHQENGWFSLSRWLLAVGLLVSLKAGEPMGAVIGGLETSPPGVEVGDILLCELNCVACHEASPEVRERLSPKAGPVLGEVARRVRPEFLREWLLGPARVKPGTTAPDLMHGRPESERQRAAEDLTHFLVSLAPGGLPDDVPAHRVAFEQGRVLYHRVGCVACHAPFEAAEGLFAGSSDPEDAAPGAAIVEQFAATSVPLGAPASKYTRASLERFLRDPLAARPAGRMPSLNLTPNEARAIATYLIGREAPPRTAPARFTVDPRKARAGRDWFQRLGCAACHALGREKPELVVRPSAPALADLSAEAGRGCLAEHPPSGVPRFHLRNDQRNALRTALARVGELSRPLTPAEVVAHTMTRLNCYACHHRDGVGGPSAERGGYFTSVVTEDLGDEGRRPPHLTGVGEKLRPEWLEQVLTNQAAVRPYLGTRMPQFGSAQVRPLVAAFGAADLVQRAPPAPAMGDLEAGRVLVGTNGLACITCHRFGPHPGINTSALDLTWMTRRLQRSWFQRYLLDPAELRPGTRMPMFWPDGEAMLKTVLEGDTSRQIESLWQYLSVGNAAQPPDGVPAPDQARR